MFEVQQAIPQLFVSKEYLTIGKVYSSLSLSFRIGFNEIKTETSKGLLHLSEAKHWQFLINPLHGGPQKVEG